MNNRRDNGAYLQTPAADPPAPPAVDDWFWGRVTGNSSLGDGRWSYTFVELEKSSTAYGGWATLSAGRSGTAYNAAEDVGYMGAAIADNAIVLVREVVVDGASAPEYWVLAVNNAGPDGATGRPMVFEKWYDIQANKAWHDVDGRDWSGRFLEAVALHDSGPPVDNGSWDEQFVSHRESFFDGWIAQQQYRWFRLYTNTNGDAQYITKVDTGDTDFYLRMNTDGKLQVMVENYSTRTSVRILVRTAHRFVAAGAEAIT